MLKDHAQLKKASEGEEVALRNIDEEAKADHYRHAACAEYGATVTVAIRAAMWMTLTTRTMGGGKSTRRGSLRQHGESIRSRPRTIKRAMPTLWSTTKLLPMRNQRSQ